MIAASKKFNDELEAWRRTRPEYQKLTQAVKAERPLAELAVLAGEAGYNNSEHVNQLREMRASALRAREEASQLPARTEIKERLNREWCHLDKALETAATG